MTLVTYVPAGRGERWVEAVRRELPRPRLLHWASACFTLCVLSFLISVAASQTFLALAGVCYAADLLRRPRPPRFPPVKLPLFLFCFFTVFSIGWAENPTVGWVVVRKLVLFLIILFTVNLIETERHIEALYRGLFVESAVAGLLAAGQFVAQYRRVRSEHPSQIYDFMTFTRIHGFMGHWMNFGGQQMLILMALLAYVMLGEPSLASEAAQAGPGSGIRRRGQGRVWGLLLGIIAASIVLNLTRGVWLGCALGALYLVARWRARWLWALPALALVAYLAGPSLVRARLGSLLHPSRDASVSIRFEMGQVGLRMIRRHPLVGVGADNVDEVYTLYLPPRTSPEVGWHENLHDNFLQLAAERGLPCLAAWLWFMGVLGWEFVRIRRRLQREGGAVWVADASIAGLLAFLAEGFFEFNFGTTPVLMVFLFVMSVPFAAEQLLAEPGRHAASKAA
jgi:O-antigen ligase